MTTYDKSARPAVGNDLDINRSITPKKIYELAESIGLNKDDLIPYGHYMAKLSSECLTRLLTSKKSGKLILVTATSPTKAGEGKTTVSIGLVQALARLGKNALAALREPSLGPVFGMKGGATGGGYSQLYPMEEINLHFTGDFHAISSANNLISAMIDNHIHQGNELMIDSRAVFQKLVLDMNDRALRDIVIGLGGIKGGYPRESGFNITAASEIMAVLCLSDSIEDLRSRIGRIVIARNTRKEPVRVSDLKIEDAVLALLARAVLPNLVQTLEQVPAIVHGGPFANIAHGTSSVMAGRAARALGEYVVTEAGFGSDLGFEKFCDIVASPRRETMTPDAVVLVTTVRALKMHGGVSFKDLDHASVDAVLEGTVNLERHVEIVAKTGLPFVIAVNVFKQDSEEEVEGVLAYCKDRGWAAAPCSPYLEGGAGVEALGEKVVELCEGSRPDFKPFYDMDDPIEMKITKLVTEVYGGSSVDYEPAAKRQLKWLKEHGFGRCFVCVAKTQYSLSDDEKRLGAPRDFVVKIRDFEIAAGAGFVVALAGDIMRMPGLTRSPSALEFKVDATGAITHLY